MKMLFATDGSEASDGAEALITSLANRTSVEIDVLAVAATSTHGPEAALFGMDALSQIHEHIEASASRSAARLGEAGFRVTRQVAEGSPAEVILREGVEGRHDVTLMGAGRHSALGRLLLGSTSFNVLHSSPSSVLIAHGAPARRTHLRVLVATDGSDHARYAATLLADVADPDRCRVTVLSVVRTPIGILVPVPLAVSGAPLESQPRPDYVEHAGEVAHACADDLRRRGFHCDTVALDGAPHSAIVEECDSGDYDLVVVGSRGLGRMRRSVLGSVSDAAVRHAPAALVGRMLERQDTV